MLIWICVWQGEWNETGETGFKQLNDTLWSFVGIIESFGKTINYKKSLNDQ